MKPRHSLSLLLPFVAACASYRPRPIDPAATARAFETRRFDDPALQRFLAAHPDPDGSLPPPRGPWNLHALTVAALYFHPEVALARARWEEARAAEETAAQIPNPSLALLPAYAQGAVIGVSPWILGLGLDLPLENPSARSARVGEARARSEEARLAIAESAWQVRSGLRRALVAWGAATRSVDLLEDLGRVRGVEAKILDRERSLGEAGGPEVLRAQVALIEAQGRVAEARRRAAEAWSGLAQALGLPSAALEGASFPIADLNQLPPADRLPTEAVAREALLGRADLLAALASYAATEERLREETAFRFPGFHLGPQYSFDQGQNVWTVGITLDLPMFHMNGGPIAQAEAARESAGRRFLSLQASVLGETARARRGYGEAIDALETARSGAAEAERGFAAARVLVAEGEEDRAALAEARMTRDEAELRASDALASAEEALGRLEDALEHPLSPPGGPLPSPGALGGGPGDRTDP